MTPGRPAAAEKEESREEGPGDGLGACMTAGYRCAQRTVSQSWRRTTDAPPSSLHKGSTLIGIMWRSAKTYHTHVTSLDAKAAPIVLLDLSSKTPL